MKIGLVHRDISFRSRLESMILKNNLCKIIISVANGYELMKEINRKDTPLNLLIIDFDIPIIDAFSIISILNKKYNNLKFIILHDHNTFISIDEMIKIHVKGLIPVSKISVDVIQEALNAIKNNKSYILKNDEKENTSVFINCHNSKFLFSEKEISFLQLIASSITYDQIADLMNVGKQSIYNYQKSIKEKTGLSNRHELVLFSIRHRIVSISKVAYRSG